MQALDAAQETSVVRARRPSGDTPIDQLFVSQFSTNGGSASVSQVTRLKPTAMHWTELLQETPSRLEIAVPGALGEATIDHWTPFQRSASVFSSVGMPPDCAVAYRPTTKQELSTQETTFSFGEYNAPAGVGRVASVHLLPSQYSDWGAPFNACPIATQELAEPQETLVRFPLPTGVMTDHSVPFQRSAKGPVDFFPTATQLVAVTSEKQETS